MLVGLEIGDLFDGDFVVAEHLHFSAQLAKILHEVVGEGRSCRSSAA
jgi:hypothetical protein